MDELEVQLPNEQVRALVELQTANVEKRTIEVVWTTGARGLRYGWDGNYYEELSLDPAHVRLDRLKAGASVLDSHNRYGGLSSALGVVEDAWIVSPTEARARLKFSDRPEVAGFVRDIMGGIIRNLSVGYSIFKMVEVGREGDTPVLRAEDWEPFELSYVTVPFDAKSQSRSADEPKHKCKVSLTTRAISMDPIEQARLEAERKQKEADHTRALDEARAQGAAEFQKRSSEIIAAVEKAGLERSFADTLVASGVTADAARAQILDKISEVNKANRTSSVITAGDLDEKTTTRDAIRDTILYRYAPQFNKPTELSNRYRSATLLDICKDILRVGGQRDFAMSKSEVAERALHTSSDFPLILGNSLKKILTDNYNAQPADFAYLTQRIGLTDYKSLTQYALSTGPSLLEVKEHGEYKRGSFEETGESMALKKHGRIIGVTREAIINDDLNAFSRIPRMWAQGCANLDADNIIAQFVGNPVMSDGKTLFHADHGNLGTAAALSIESLAIAVASLKTQKGPSAAGEAVQYLRIRPKYLIVPPGLETLAIQLTTSIDPVTFQTVNPFAFLEVKSDPSLTGTAWYLAADAGQVDLIGQLYMIGEEGPQLSERQGFDVDGIEYKVRYDTGAKALDYRGFYKNPGV